MRELPEGWVVESTCFRNPNVVSCEVVTGDHQTPLIVSYLPPSTLDHLPYLEDDLNRFLGSDHVVLGNLNLYIVFLKNPQYQYVADLLVSFGLVYILGHS